MKLMIDIPKALYEDIQRRSTAIQADGDTLENAVLNGTIINGTITDNTSFHIKGDEKPYWINFNKKEICYD